MQNRINVKHPQLIMLTLIFILPMIISWILYYYHAHFQFKTSQHGTLINPPLTVSTLFPETERKWRILYIVRNHCNDSSCKTMNHQLHQVQKALGKNSDRVNIILMDEQLSELPHLAKKAGLVIANGNIYLVDPLGNLFMSYPNKTNALDVLKDLKRVLEVSQIG